MYLSIYVYIHLPTLYACLIRLFSSMPVCILRGIWYWLFGCLCPCLHGNVDTKIEANIHDRTFIIPSWKLPNMNKGACVRVYLWIPMHGGMHMHNNVWIRDFYSRRWSIYSKDLISLHLFLPIPLSLLHPLDFRRKIQGTNHIVPVVTDVVRKDWNNQNKPVLDKK